MAYRTSPDTELLQAALLGYQHQVTLIDEKIAEINRELGGKPAQLEATGTDKRRRGMSEEGRLRVAAAQRKRWAKAKGLAVPQAEKRAPKAKRQISAAGKKRIAEATRKRWAAYRAEKAAAAT